jgi:hypothetical protein
MTRDTDGTEDGTNGHTGRMPDFPLNRNTGIQTETSAATNGGGQSRRGFLAASAAVGLGAAGMVGQAGADEHDADHDHEDMDDDHDHDHGDGDDNDDEEFSLQNIIDDPEAYYVDIHTADFPQGSVRGQLQAEPGTMEFSVRASPEEVPDEEGGGEEGATALFEFTLDPEDEVICFDICANGVTPPYESPANTATHIHVGDPGVVGPPVVLFPDPQPRDPEFDGPRTSSGCLPGELAFQTGV